MPFNPRKLRHRVNIERPVFSLNTDTGESGKPAWETFATNVPAEIAPLSVREFISSQASQSQIVARITIRFRQGLDATMRIVHNGRIYNPQGWLADSDSGLQYLTAPCTAGVNEG